MRLHGLAGVSRNATASGAMQYLFEADPDLAWNGVRRSGMLGELRHPYPLATEALLIRALATIRRDYPYWFLLTNDVPRDAYLETHLDVVAGLFDTSFMKRFPNTTIHLDLSRHPDPDRYFSFGPRIYSRLFNVGRDDITFLWDALLNNCINPVNYYLLYSSRQIRMLDLTSRIAGCRSRSEFDTQAFALVDLIAYVQEVPNLYLFAMSEKVRKEIEGALVWEPPQGTEAVHGGSSRSGSE